MKEYPEKNQGEAFSSIIEEVNLLLRRDQVINMLVYEPDPPYFNDTLMELFYWIHYKNSLKYKVGCLDVFHMFTQSIKFF